MSLPANFPEEPGLRLRLGMESAEGGGAAASSVHPERLFAKPCYERQGAGTVGLAGGRADPGGNRSGICPGRSVQVPCFLFRVPGPCHFILCPTRFSNHQLSLKPRKPRLWRPERRTVIIPLPRLDLRTISQARCNLMQSL